MPRPKKFYDDTGLCRVTLKKGSPRQPGGERPHAQYVQADGRRVDANGLPVARTSIEAFAAIQWDFDDEPDDDLGEGADEEHASAEAGAVSEDALDFTEVAAFAPKSPTLLGGMQSLDALGYALLEGPREEANQVIASACRILVDPAIAARATTTGTVAREIGRALRVLPKVGARGRERDAFARENAAVSVREEGEALLFAAAVRGEIIDAGGPDVGVAGASGDALALAEEARMGRVLTGDAAAALGAGALGPEHADAAARYAELWGYVHDAVNGAGAGPPPGAEAFAAAQRVIDVVHRLSTASAFDRGVVESILGAPLYPVAATNPEHVVSTAAFEDGVFSAAELTEPAPYSRLVDRRLVLTPSGSLPIATLAGWYGPGTPIHLDGRAEQPLATIGYTVEGQEIAFTFSVLEGDVRFVSVRRRR